MILNRTLVRGLSTLLAVGLFSGSIFAADQAAQNDEVAQLRAALAAQQKQLETLQHMMEQQQQMLDKAMTAQQPQRAASSNVQSLGTVASLSPVIPVAPVAAVAIPPAQTPSKAAAPVSKNPCEAAPDANQVPPYIRLGSTCVIPVGFMDVTSIWRDKAAGSGLGTNFGSVPFANTTAGGLSEFRFNIQNSRLGFRVDGDWKGAHFMGYNEFDFVGTSASNNLGVTNGAVVPRLRLFWVDVRKDKWEFLAGQSWSMLTPNRKAISALPSDLFYSQVIEINYMAGLTWTRQPGVRVLFHPNKTVTTGVSLENPNQYAGGSAGASKITVPTGAGACGSSAGCGSFLGSQLDDTSTSFFSTPNVMPDVIAKIAVDPSSKFHADVAGIVRTFKSYNFGTNQHFTKVGGGVQFGANLELVKNFRVMTTNYWSEGGGRYLFGQVPDAVVRTDGSLSMIHAGGTVDGVEATVKNTLLYAYYGLIYAGKNIALDTNGKTQVGYGATGASQNRAINEFTVGFNQTIWKSPRYGAINFMGQYQYLQRNPWYVAPGGLTNAHDNTILTNIRYTLPGSMPNF